MARAVWRFQLFLYRSDPRSGRVGCAIASAMGRSSALAFRVSSFFVDCIDGVGEIGEIWRDVGDRRT